MLPNTLAIDLYGDPLPAHAIARLGTVRLRKDIRSGLAFAADGKHVWSCWLGDLRLWELESGKLIRTIELEDLSLQKFVVSREGRRIAVAGTIYDSSGPLTVSALRVYDAGSGEQLAEMRWERRDDLAAGLALIDGGRIAVFGGEGGVLRFWDITTGTLSPRQLPLRKILDLDVSPDGNTLAAVGRDPYVVFWNWRAGDRHRRVSIGNRGAVAVCFLSDGRSVAIGSDFQDGAMLLDVESGRLIRTLLNGVNDHIVLHAAVAPNGSAVALPSYLDHSLVVVHPMTGQLLHRLPMGAEPPSRVVISPDGKWVAACGSNTSLTVWNLSTGTRLHSSLQGHEDAVVGAIQFSPDGTEVASAAQDGTVRVWNAATGQQRLKLQHSATVGGMAISPDGRLIASNSSDRTVRVWNAADGSELFRLAGHETRGPAFRLVQFTPDSLRLGAWGADMYLRLWDVTNGKSLAEHNLQNATAPGGDNAAKEPLSTDAVAFSPNCRLFAAVFKHEAHVFDVISGREQYKLAIAGDEPDSVAFTPDCQQLLTLQPGPPVQIKQLDGTVAYRREPFCTVRVWPLGADAPRLEKTFPGLLRFSRLAVSADGRLAAVAVDGSPTEILIWSLQTGDELLCLKANEGHIRTIAFSPDGRRLATGCGSGSALVWDISEAYKQE
ncbi:MAG: PQQ-binding-like beta-propeller repeat protein [Planctomycetes bacterium]|nr:PQQ-binding-like beta-propeller repeat protein [Planctomycetota bacterium]